MLGGLRAPADYESLGKPKQVRSRLAFVLPVADVAYSSVLRSAGQLNELACVAREMAMAMASLWVVEGTLVRSYGSYHVPAVVAMIVGV